PMPRRQLFRLTLTLIASRAHPDDLRAQRRRSLALDRRSIVGHHDDSLHAQRPRRVSHPLRMIAARIGNDSARPLFFRKRGNLVVSSPQFEGANGLLVFGLEEEPSRIFFAQLEFNQTGTHRDAAKAGLGGDNVGESDHFSLLSTTRAVSHETRVG